MTKNPANSAFVYVPGNYDIPKQGVVGRQSATAGFLKGFLRHSGVGEYWCYAHAAEDFEHFRRFVAASDVPPAPIRCISPLGMSELAGVGALYRPGPDIGDYAWLRRHFDQRAFSLIGVTHTVADHAAMDAIGRLLVAPVQPWDALVCSSAAVKAVVEELLDGWAEYLGRRFKSKVEPACKLPVIPFGVDCDAYAKGESYAEDRGAFRKELGIGEDDVAVLFVGRLTHIDKANPVPMYLAMEMTARMGGGKAGRAFHLIQAGQFPGPDTEQGFKEAAAAFAPTVKHHFIDGSRNETFKNAWKAADIFISLSDNIQESFGLTPIEAMAAGLAVVVGDWDGYRDTVRDGKEGFAVPTLAPPPGSGREIAYFHGSAFAGYKVLTAATSQSTAVDVAASADALVRLAEDPGLRRKMGESGRKRARQLYDWRAVVAAYQELWAELAEIRATAQETTPVAPDRPADPLKGDPFALFKGHPTATIGRSDTLALSPVFDPGLLDRLSGSGIAVPLASVLLGGDDLAAVIKSLEAGPKTMGELLETVGEQKRTQMSLSAGWLAKMGLVVVEGGGPGGDLPAPGFASSETWKMLSKT